MSGWILIDFEQIEIQTTTTTATKKWYESEYQLPNGRRHCQSTLWISIKQAYYSSIISIQWWFAMSDFMLALEIWRETHKRIVCVMSCRKDADGLWLGWPMCVNNISSVSQMTMMALFCSAHAFFICIDRFSIESNPIPNPLEWIFCVDFIANKNNKINTREMLISLMNFVNS